MSMALSFSKIDTLEDCPRKFKYIYIDQMQGLIKSDAMAIGSGIHDFLEYYSINHQASLKDCEDVYVKSADKSTALVRPKAIMENIGMVKYYMESKKVLTPYRDVNDNKPLTEKWFKLDCGDGVKCNGKIDLVTEKLSVVDYKTASKKYRQKDADEVLEGKGLQLSIYAAAFYQWFKKVPNKVGFQVLLKDCSTIQNIGSDRTEKDIEDTKQHIRDVYARYLHFVESGVFPKGLNPRCFWCPEHFKDLCRGEV